ncbi:hypothetical protein [Neorhizobium sp. P12A]|uniref:hypothetical protein n=1 Tax=Neorhizobium sp. P12A TaxID=2268027 RepID=UPI00165DC247|nr:hypothetical protein [Neorhizobium sp. P12A]
MDETIRRGRCSRKEHTIPAMLVVELRTQPDDRIFAELLWLDGNMKARQANLDTELLEHVPMQE